MVGGRSRGMVGSRSWGICRSRGMIGGRSWGISWGRGMVEGRSWGMVTILMVLDKRLVRTGDSLILDISMILLVLIHIVVNNLGSAVRELHSVLTFHIISISLLSP